MATFFLIGGHDFDLKSSYIATVLLSLTSKLKPSILLFPIASMDNERVINNFFKEYDGLNFSCDVVKLTMKPDLDDIILKAKQSDIVFFTGGNTIKCLDFLHRNGYDKLIYELANLDLIIAGVSAGANILCSFGLADAYSYKDNDSFYNYKIQKGLGILPFSFCPHFNLGDRILYFKDMLSTDEAYALDENCAIYIKNNRLVGMWSLPKYHVYYFKKECKYKMEYLKQQKMACLGPKGTFCDVAASKYINENQLSYDIDYYSTFRSVAKAIYEDEIGILPVENTIDGFVQETLDILHDNNLSIIKEIKIPISFNFISKAKHINDVRKVYVQFKAKQQCLPFLNEHGFEIIETESNMTSYERLKNSGPTYGAIVPSHVISKDFPLVINSVEELSENETRFLVLTSKKSENLLKKQCALMLTARVDIPGILTEALMVFKKHNINLKAIMSRPTKEMLGKYYFYIEFNLTDDNTKVDKVVDELNSREFFNLKLLGYF